MSAQQGMKPRVHHRWTTSLTVHPIVAMMAVPGVALSQAVPEPVMIVDQTFNEADWRVARVDKSPGATYDVMRSTSGGNPMSYRQMSHTMEAPWEIGDSTWVKTCHEYVAVPYVPGVQGLIQSIDVSFDAKVTQVLPSGAAAGPDVNYVPVLYQGNSTYYLYGGWYFTAVHLGDGWTHFSQSGLRADAFLTSPGGVTPDFSTSGEPITFGFQCATGNTASGATIETSKTFGIDNFTIAIYNLADSDGDGIYDDWEINGGVPYIDSAGIYRRYELPNANWQHANLWIEHDSMYGASLQPASIALVEQAFAASPYDRNPDGLNGITLTVQLDETELQVVEQWPTTGCWPQDFALWRNSFFGSPAERSDQGRLQAKAKAYRYCIGAIDSWPIKYGGCGYMPGDDFVLYLGAISTVEAGAAAFMHELGHNLGLGHGGGDEVNNKPNYPSVMNYSVTYDPEFLDYSREGPEDGLQDLDENCLDETAGLGSPWGYYRQRWMPYGVNVMVNNFVARKRVWIPLDGSAELKLVMRGDKDGDFGDLFNTGFKDFVFSPCVKQDLNYLGTPDEAPSAYQELRSHNDWAHIKLPTAAAQGAAAAAPVIPTGEPTKEQIEWAAKNLVPPEWVQLPEWKNTDTNYRYWHPFPFAGQATKVHQVFHADLFRAHVRPGSTKVRITGIALNPEPVYPSFVDSTNVRVRLGYTNRRPGAQPPQPGMPVPPSALSNYGLSVPDTIPANATSPMVTFFAADRLTWSFPSPLVFPPTATQQQITDWRLNNFAVRFLGTGFEYDPNQGNLLVEIESTTPVGYGVGNGGLQGVYSIYANGPATMWTSRSYKSSVSPYFSRATPTEALRMKFLLEDEVPVAQADAGADVSVDEGQLVTLDGSGSAGGETMTYAWTQVSGGHSVTLADANTATPSFTAPLVTVGGETLTFQLTLTADGASDTDTVSVTVVNVNHVPVADAGEDQSVVEGTPVTLHGEGSFDVDNDPIGLVWTQVGGPTVALVGDGTANPTFAAPYGGGGGAPGVVATLEFQLLALDGFPPDEPAPGFTLGHVVDYVTVVVTNLNNDPMAAAGDDQTVNENGVVTLNGAVSGDPDGDPLMYSWQQLGTPTVTLMGGATDTPSFIAPFVAAGGVDLTFQLVVYDGWGGLSADDVVVHVQNVNDPPLVSAARPTVGMLWPPNHAMVRVGIVGVSDPNDNAIIAITGVTQDEPTEGLGDGDTTVDAVISPDGTVLLRAERSGTGDGRVYHIHFTAADPEGIVSGVVTVSVPHQKRTVEAIDGGELFDSTN